MSNSSLGKFARDTLTDIQASAGKSKGGLSRSKLNRTKGQILIINKQRFMTTLGSLVPQIRSNQKIRDQIWEKFSTEAATRSKRISSDRLKDLTEAAFQLKKEGRLQKTDFVFFVNTYGVASYLKSITLRKCIKEVFSASGREFTAEEQGNLSLLAGKGNKFGAQLGHSELTKAGQVGVASSAIRVAAAKQAIHQFGVGDEFDDLSDKSKENFVKITDAVTKYEKDIQLVLDHEMIVEDGGKRIKKDYIPVLSWQGTIINQTLAQIERAAIASFENSLKEVEKLEGSPSLKEAIESVILYEISSGVKRTPKKVTGKPKKSVKTKGRGKASKKIKSAQTTRVIRDDRVPKSAVSQFATGTSRQQSLFSLNSLLGPLNQKLSEVVKKNMKEPRLQNRTGRFADSVQVVDVQTTPQGFPSIGYTYQRAPYDKFEKDPQRDPRKLIDQSIREVASQFALGRFYTRRQ